MHRPKPLLPYRHPAAEQPATEAIRLRRACRPDPGAARRAQPALPPGPGEWRPASRRHASRSGRQLDLGPKEFGVLELLLAADGRVVPTEELLERVWDEMADPFTTAVKVTISRLRRKLGDPPVIETVAQAGYRI